MAFRIVAEFPRRWTGSPCGITKKKERLLPRNNVPTSHERLLPELALLVTSRIDEPFVLFICHFVTVDEEVVDFDFVCGKR